MSQRRKSMHVETELFGDYLKVKAEIAEAIGEIGQLSRDIQTIYDVANKEKNLIVAKQANIQRQLNLLSAKAENHRELLCGICPEFQQHPRGPFTTTGSSIQDVPVYGRNGPGTNP